jgi:hypothetical protein
VKVLRPIIIGHVWVTAMPPFSNTCTIPTEPSQTLPRPDFRSPVGRELPQKMTGTMPLPEVVEAIP